MRFTLLCLKKYSPVYVLLQLCVFVFATFIAHATPSTNGPGNALSVGAGNAGPLPFNQRYRHLIANNDPIRFSIECNKQTIQLGETVDLTITAELLNVSPNLMFSLPGANAYRLKLLLPSGFEQTGGDFRDYVGDELSASRTTVTYHIKGHFVSVAPNTGFRLLRGHALANDQSLFVEKAVIALKPTSTEREQPSGAFSLTRRTQATSTLYVVDTNETTRSGARAAAGNHRGFLEFATCDIIGGWVLDQSSPRQSVNLDIFINGVKAATISANQDRQDVADAYRTNFNKYGYRWNVPDSYKSNTPLTISVKIAGTSDELIRSPLTTASCPGSGKPTGPSKDSCAFSIEANNINATCGATIKLEAACKGECDQLSYAWSGNGLDRGGQSVSFNAPTTNGTYAYTVKATKQGCTAQTAISTVIVSGCSSTTVTPTNPNYQGFLDKATCEGVAGWAVDHNSPQRPISVDVFVDGKKVATVLANEPRSDVASALQVDGYNNYGYSYTIPDSLKKGAPLTIAVRAAGSTFQLSQSPRQTAACPNSPTTTPNCSFSTTAKSVSATCGSTVKLEATCTGNCDQLSYAWSGNGVDRGGQSVSFNAPTTNGIYTYTLKATKEGCTPQTTAPTVTVSGCSSTTVTPANPSYQGFLDKATCDSIVGWAADRNTLRQSVSVDIFADGVKVATVLANEQRSDVADFFRVNDFNRYGYKYIVPDSLKKGAPLTIAVRAAGSTFQLSHSPLRTVSCPSSQTITPNCSFSTTAKSVSATCGSTVKLEATCAGNCDQLSYAWSGNGVDRSGQSVSFTAPTTNGTYTYTLKATKEGCPPQTTTATVTVSGCSSTTTTPANPNYKGFLEFADCDKIAGWAIDLNAARQSISVDLFVNGVKTATILADQQRQDIADAYGITNFNRYGYRYTLPDSLKKGTPLTIAIRAAGSTFQLSQSPRQTPSCPGSQTVTPACSFSIGANSASTSCGGTVNLQATCAGNCDQLSYAWSGNGVDRSGQSVSFNAPTTNGTYTYTLKASRDGCGTQTTTVTVTVSGCSPAPAPSEYPVLSSPIPLDKRPILQNERVRVAIDLGVGGVIREVTDLQVGENMINCMVKSNGVRDPGRDDQISLYALPDANTGWTRNGKPVLDNIGYNPVQGGDVAGNFSPLLGYGRTDKMLYSKTRALLWGINNEPGDYVIEQWIWLEGNIVRRHVKITGDRQDQTNYADVRQQELPCTYTNSAYYQYYVVQGSPYSNAPLVNVNTIPNLTGDGLSLAQRPNQGIRGPFNVNASEPWIVAVRPNTNRGLALHTPFSHEFKIGHFGEVGYGPAESSDAGYIANTMSLRLDNNGVYEFDINMVVGTLNEIRNTINTMPRSETKPNYVFANNATRHGFYYRKAYDQGFPVGNELIIKPTDRRFKLVSPHKGYKASDFGTIYIRMRAITYDRQMVLEWRKVGQSELEAAQAGQMMTFAITGDNQYRTIAIPVKNSPLWNGVINEFKIRYANSTEAGINDQEFGVKWLSATDLGDQ